METEMWAGKAIVFSIGLQQFAHTWAWSGCLRDSVSSVLFLFTLQMHEAYGREAALARDSGGLCGRIDICTKSPQCPQIGDPLHTCSLHAAVVVVFLLLTQLQGPESTWPQMSVLIGN
jgi:hypothetical protein